MKSATTPTKKQNSQFLNQNFPIRASPLQIINNIKHNQKITATNIYNNCHHVFVQGYQNGIVLIWLQKHNINEEPYLYPDYKLFQQNPTLMHSLGITAILERRDSYSKTFISQSTSQTNYTWKQFLYIIESNNNTPAYRKNLAKKLIQHLNKNLANTNLYKYPCQCKFAGDKTGSHLMPINNALVDIDVIAIMAYQFIFHTDLQQNKLSKTPDILKCINHCKQMIKNYPKQHQKPIQPHQTDIRKYIKTTIKQNL